MNKYSNSNKFSSLSEMNKLIYEFSFIFQKEFSNLNKEKLNDYFIMLETLNKKNKEIEYDRNTNSIAKNIKNISFVVSDLIKEIIKIKDNLTYQIKNLRAKVIHLDNEFVSKINELSFNLKNYRKIYLSSYKQISNSIQNFMKTTTSKSYENVIINLNDLDNLNKTSENNFLDFYEKSKTIFSNLKNAHHKTSSNNNLIAEITNDFEYYRNLNINNNYNNKYNKKDNEKLTNFSFCLSNFHHNPSISDSKLLSKTPNKNYMNKLKSNTEYNNINCQSLILKNKNDNSNDNNFNNDDNEYNKEYNNLNVCHSTSSKKLKIAIRNKNINNNTNKTPISKNSFKKNSKKICITKENSINHSNLSKNEIINSSLFNLDDNLSPKLNNNSKSAIILHSNNKNDKKKEISLFYLSELVYNFISDMKSLQESIIANQSKNCKNDFITSSTNIKEMKIQFEKKKRKIYKICKLILNENPRNYNSIVNINLSNINNITNKNTNANTHSNEILFNNNNSSFRVFDNLEKTKYENEINELKERLTSEKKIFNDLSKENDDLKKENELIIAQLNVYKTKNKNLNTYKEEIEFIQKQNDELCNKFIIFYDKFLTKIGNDKKIYHESLQINNNDKDIYKKVNDLYNNMSEILEKYNNISNNNCNTNSINTNKEKEINLQNIYNELNEIYKSLQDLENNIKSETGSCKEVKILSETNNNQMINLLDSSNRNSSKLSFSNNSNIINTPKLNNEYFAQIMQLLDSIKKIIYKNKEKIQNKNDKNNSFEEDANNINNINDIIEDDNYQCIGFKGENLTFES